MYSLDLPVILYQVLIIYVMHPRKLRACAGPRRVAARRGEAPMVYIKKYARVNLVLRYAWYVTVWYE